MLTNIYYLIKNYCEEKRILNNLLKKYNYPTGDKERDKEIYKYCKKKTKEIIINYREL